MAIDVARELADLAAQLTAVGIPAAIEPGEVPVPGAWVTGREATVTTLGGGGTVTAYVYLIAPDNGVLNAHKELTRLLGLVPADWLAGPVSLNEGVALPANPTAPLPAYRVPVDLDS